MYPGAIAATVLCGRQVRQSRDGIVETTLETWEQRVAFTPGHAWTDPVRTCQSAAGSKWTGSKPADAECVCCTATKTPPAKASVARPMRQVLLMNCIRLATAT